MSLRCSVVGTGSVALNNYLPYLAALEGVELAYLSRSRAKSVHAQNLFGGIILDDVKALAAWVPDMTFVLTNETQHETVIDQLIIQGIQRVFVEKPLLAANGQAHVDESDFWRAADLIRRAEAAGTEVAVGFNYRFFDSVQELARINGCRDFGRLTGVVAEAHFACWSHAIDLISIFAGPLSSLVALNGAPSYGESEMRSPDRVIAFTGVAGVTGTLRGSSSGPWNGPLLSIALQYERGRVEISDLDVSMSVFDAARNRTEITALSAHVSRWNCYDTSFRASLEAYLASIRCGAAPPVTGWDGLRELQVEAAIARSIVEHRPIDIQSKFPLTGP